MRYEFVWCSNYVLIVFGFVCKEKELGFWGVWWY